MEQLFDMFLFLSEQIWNMLELHWTYIRRNRPRACGAPIEPVRSSALVLRVYLYYAIMSFAMLLFLQIQQSMLP